MRRVNMLMALSVGGAACAHAPYAVPPMVETIRAEAATIDDEHLRSAVMEYASYLDTLRIVHSTEARSELGKLNHITLASLLVGTGTAAYALSSASDKSKSQVAGVTGILAAFGTAVVSQFHHKEDSQAYRACSRELEAVLSTFVVPRTQPGLDSLRIRIQTRLDSLDCLAPLDH